MNTKPAAQMSLEAIIEQNRREAETLRLKAEEKLAENERIVTEMNKVLHESKSHTALPPPTSAPPSRFVAAYRNGHALAQLATEHGETEPATAPQEPTVPKSVAPDSLSKRAMAEKEVIYAATAIVRSWQRRKKAKYRNQEKELMNAVERLTWEP